MRGLPFFKAKNKPQFAGLNFSDASSSGGGGGGGSYTLPTATASRLGGVKIGTGVNVASDGTISVSGGGGGGDDKVIGVGTETKICEIIGKNVYATITTGNTISGEWEPIYNNDFNKRIYPIFALAYGYFNNNVFVSVPLITSTSNTTVNGSATNTKRIPANANVLILYFDDVS